MKNFIVDSQDCLNLQKYGTYEKEERRIFRALILDGDTVVDAGAHIGYHTLLFSQLVGDEGTVFAFEPEKNNFELLKKNVRIGEYDNVVLERAAVSDVTGQVELYLSEESSGDHRIFSAENERASYIVESVRLDDYFCDDHDVNFIKMDIQGAELRALYGMKRLLANDNLKMIIEFWPYGIAQSGHDPEKFLKLLHASGFELYDMLEGTFLYPTLPESYGETFFVNLYCTKKVRRARR